MDFKHLKETTLAQQRRTLLRVALGDGERSELTDVVNSLMGSKPEARFRFIQEHAAFAKDLDI
jgi:topoisomerase-4 subunit B